MFLTPFTKANLIRVGGGATSSYAPYYVWSFNEVGQPTASRDDVVLFENGSGVANWDYTPSIEGNYSLAYTTNDSSSYIWSDTVPNPITASGEVWFAFLCRLTGSALGGVTTWFRFGDTGFGSSGGVNIATNRQVRALVFGGGTGPYLTHSVIPYSATEKVAMMMRFKTGSGADAECEVWITDTPSAGWGPTSSFINDGTEITNIGTVGITQGTTNSGSTMVSDIWAVDYQPISASYFAQYF